ncbi:MAG: ATP-binding protein [Nitriliruptorales bacterium]|nr:ATP-binding protein [Nitriliruptorales bacterium]
MHTGADRRLDRDIRGAMAAASAVGALAAVVMLAWLIDLDAPTRLLPGAASMKFNTAAGLLLAAGGLAAHIRGSRGTALACAATLGALAGVTMLTIVTGWDPGLDQLVVQDDRPIQTSTPGRMSPGTAVALLANAGVIAALTFRRRVVADVVAAATVVLGAVALIGYLYGVSALYRVSIYTSMAVHTAGALLVLGLAELAAPPSGGMWTRLRSDLSGSHATRRLLPAAIGLPILLGWLELIAVDAGWFDARFGAAILITMVVVALSTLIWMELRANADARRARAAAEEQRERLIDELEERVEERTRDLAASERLIHTMVDQVRDYAIFRLDVHGRITSWNDGAHRLKGYEEAEVIGRSIDIFYPTDARDDGLPSRLLTVAGEQGSVEDEGWRIRKDGSRFWANVVVTALHDEDGDLLGFTKITRDLTDRRRQTEELAQLTKELTRSNQDLRSFASSAAHDLREPLRLVTGFLDLLEERYGDQLPEEGHEIVEEAVHGAERMRALIDDLLDLARAQTVELELQPLPLADALQDALATLAVAIEETGTSVTVGPGLPVVLGDRSQLRLLFQNLLQNAIKYRSPGEPPRIEVSAHEHGGRWVVQVSDNGIGFDRRQAQRIFEPFQRLHGAGAYEGTGMGLAICQRIVERHGGEMWADSDQEAGATFSFTLRGRSEDAQVGADGRQERGQVDDRRPTGRGQPG